MLVIQAGFWSPQNDSFFQRCPHPEACLKGSSCAPGYSNNLCATCAATFFKRGVSCERCPESAALNNFFVFLGFILISAVLFFLTRQTLKAGSDNSAYKILAERLKKELGGDYAMIYVVDKIHLRGMVGEAGLLRIDDFVEQCLLNEDIRTSTSLV